MNKNQNFTMGGIAGPLVRFAVPVFSALFLQVMYGAVDLLVVGQFADKADVSAVATGAHIMMTLTNLVASMAIGATMTDELLQQRSAREICFSTCLTSIWGF